MGLLFLREFYMAYYEKGVLFMKGKDVMVWLIHGAAVTLGGLLITEGYTKLRDPYFRAKIRGRFEKFKGAFQKKVKRI